MTFLPRATLLPQAEGASRDLLLLDIALDGYFRLLVERMDKGAMQGEAGRTSVVGCVVTCRKARGRLRSACTSGALRMHYNHIPWAASVFGGRVCYISMLCQHRPICNVTFPTASNPHLLSVRLHPHRR